MRKICYITGTRADFGLMRSTLEAIERDPRLELAVVVTGMHLAEQYGMTVREIERSGLAIAACIAVPMEPATGGTMARNIGRMLEGFVDALEQLAPNLVVLLGDRGEMLAGALAAIHLNIPIVHIHGGERSGTVDEPVRHAISKLSHFHFTATAQAAQRLVRMGEQPASVHVTGAPGLDGLADLAQTGRAALCESAGLDPLRPVAVMVFHPVLQEVGSGESDAECIIDALLAQQCQVVALMPNSDAGSDGVRAALARRGATGAIKVFAHFPRAQFVSWMAAADLLIGNSSAGIIEAATFGTPVVNIGSRQGLRERNANVVDAAADETTLAAVIGASLRRGRYPAANVYGDGCTAGAIVHLLASLPLDSAVMLKSNAY